MFLCLSPTQSYLHSWVSRDSLWASRMKFTFTKWKAGCNSITATLQKMQPTLRLISLMEHILKVTKMWVTIAVLMSKTHQKVMMQKEVSCSRTGKGYMKRSLSAKILTWDFETSWPPHILELCFPEESISSWIWIKFLPILVVAISAWVPPKLLSGVDVKPRREILPQWTIPGADVKPLH